MYSNTGRIDGFASNGGALGSEIHENISVLRAIEMPSMLVLRRESLYSYPKYEEPVKALCCRGYEGNLGAYNVKGTSFTSHIEFG